MLSSHCQRTVVNISIVDLLSEKKDLPAESMQQIHKGVPGPD